MTAARTLVLFNYDWDAIGFGRLGAQNPIDSEGFDLFSFPSNARLAFFDLARWTEMLARQARARGWHAVSSSHEQFGALAAALLAERMGWPGTPVAAVLACQHKLYARRVLAEIAPETNTPFALMPSAYGEAVPEALPAGLDYPVFIKPVKAAFSVLARTVSSRAELHAMTRFAPWELWVIRHLVEPFERLARARLPEAGTAHRLMLERPVLGLPQYNLDGYVFNGELCPLGVVESVMYPGTQAFQRFVYPCALAETGRQRAIEVARRFLREVGFSHGLFNMEFFYDAAQDRLTVIEFNPRLAAQFSDLYRQVEGIDLHQVALDLAHGIDPATRPRLAPSAGVAASFVYRSFDPQARPPMPGTAAEQAFADEFPDALLFSFGKNAGQIARDFKWLGSYRYGIVHLAGRNLTDLAQRCERASHLLGWQTLCHAAEVPAATSPASSSYPPLSLEVS